MTMGLLLAAAAVVSPGEMNRVADAFDQAQLSQDAAALRRMTDDRLVFIDGTGKRQGKAEFITGWTLPGDRYEPIKLVDRTFLPLGRDAFVTTAETNLKGVSGGTAFASRFRFSDTFHRIGGKWRAIHIQVTRMAAE